MKKLTLFLTIVCFFACGKTAKQKSENVSDIDIDIVSTLKTDILQKDTIIRFVPEIAETYKIDTIVDAAQNVRVKMITTTRMDKSIEQTSEPEEEPKFYRYYYRENAIKMQVFFDNTLKYDNTFIKENFADLVDKDFYSKAILYNVWFVNYDKLSKIVSVIILLGVPDTDWGQSFMVKIDNNGNQTLENYEWEEEDFE